ncbi:MAG: flagellar export chaperone FliS [Peptococcaceae bacterium]|nr:MAG: flagellar export chaperone FliS [Peptococcaceae bacterium]
MALLNPYQQYQQNAVLNAGPEQLLLMLYNGAIKFINQACSCLDKNDITGTNNAIIKAQDVIIYLKDILNMNYEIARPLSSLYEYMYERLVEANIKKERLILHETLKMIEDLKNTWMEAIRISQNKPPGQG